MTISIFGVPERLASRKEGSRDGETVEYAPNGQPGVQPSPLVSRQQAHAFLKDLAIRDRWSALYDPTNEDSLIYSGSDIIGIRDSLGKFPDLISAPRFGETGVGPPLKLIQRGAVRMLSGMVSALFPAPMDRISGTALSHLPEVDSEVIAQAMIFSGAGDPLSPNALAYPAVSTIAFNTGGASPAQVAVSSVGNRGLTANDDEVQTGLQVISFDTLSGDIHSGYRQLVAKDGEGDLDEAPLPPAGMSSGDTMSVFGETENAGMGVTFLSDAGVGAPVRNRAVSLLAKLSGAMVGFPPGTPNEPDTYLIEDPLTGERLLGHAPRKIDPLASVTKVMTCYVALRDFITPVMMGQRITLRDPYASSNAPSTRAGDQLTWEDAIFASMQRSHNYITQNIAHSCGLLIDPSSADPRATFMSYVQDQADLMGLVGAEFPDAQGGPSKASPEQVLKILKAASEDTPWLLTVMEGRSHTYRIYPQGGATPDLHTLNSLTTENVNGVLTFPELKASKGGNNSASVTLVSSYTNPLTRREVYSYLRNPASRPIESRWLGQRQMWDVARTPLGTPAEWSAAKDTDLSFGVEVGAQQAIGIRSPYVSDTDVELIPIPHPPVVRPGDTVSFSVQMWGAANTKLTASIPISGGKYTDSSESPTKSVSGAGIWRTLSFNNLEVEEAGILNPRTFLSSGINRPTLMMRNVTLSVHSKTNEEFVYDMPVESFTVNLSSQSLDSADSSGSVGEFDAGLLLPQYNSVFGDFGIGFVQGKKVHLDTGYGTLIGTVSEVSLQDGETLQVSGETNMGVLNAFNITAPPFSGTIPALILSYFSLLGDAAPPVEFDPELKNRRITAPGWHGELWFHLKLLCAAEKLLISVTSEGGIFVAPSGESDVLPVPLTGTREEFSQANLAQFVEVYHYGNRWVDSFPIYPPGGWSEEVEVLSVNAGEEAEQTLQLSASLTSFDPPEMKTFVSRDHDSSSVYTVVGSDGFEIQPEQWRDYGGRVEFSLGEDTRSINVKMVGAEGITGDNGEPITTFSLALASDTSGSRYSTIRILGTGVLFDRKVTRYPTGVSSTATGTEVGATIDNPFLSSRGQAAAAGALAAYKFSGSTPGLSQSSLGPHLGLWGGDVLRGVVSGDRQDFRVREVSYTPEGATLSGEYHLTYLNSTIPGTYKNVQDKQEGLTYGDAQRRGKLDA